MDYLRSCYTTKMRFTAGGTPVGVVWYFAPTGAKVFASRHQFASLNYSKGLFPTSDTSIGEVVGATRPWSNGANPAYYDGQRFGGIAGNFTSGCSGTADLPWSGSPAMPTACFLSPAAPCLSIPYDNYAKVDVSFDSGVTWNVLTSNLGGDHWRGTFTVSGRSVQIDTSCGLITTASQGLAITDNATSTTGNYGTYSYASSYPATWTFHTVAGTPTGWAGGTVLIRTRCNGGMTAVGHAVANTPTSMAITLSALTHANDSLFAWFSQIGNSSGGSIGIPSGFSSWTSLHIGPTNGQMLYWKPNAGAVSSYTLTGIARPDCASLVIWGSATRPSPSIVQSVFKDAQAAATSLPAGTLTFTGDDATSFACWHNAASSNVGAPASSTFTGVSSPWLFSANQNISDGAGPPFNTLNDGMVRADPFSAGTYSPTAVTSVSRAWASAHVIVR